MSAGLNRRLDRLEAAVPGPHAVLVALDCPPDGRRHVLMSDGSLLPDNADWRPLAVGWTTVIGSVDIDAVVGRAPGVALGADGGLP